MKLAIPLLLLVLVLASGCTGIPDIFGGDVIKVQTRTVEDPPKNPIVIKNIMTIPTSPVLPGYPVVLSFIIENTDKINPVNNVVIDLFNAPGFRNSNGELCNSGIGVCAPDPDSDIKQRSKTVNGNENIEYFIESILPGEEHLVQYTLLAPSTEQIANIKTQARLDFKVLYDFKSTMNFVVPVVNKDEIIRRQREGQAVNIMFDISHSSGPVSIDVEPLGINYILEKYTTVLLFNIRNTGSGTIKNSEISKYTDTDEQDCYNRCMDDYGDSSYCLTIICAGIDGLIFNTGQTSIKGIEIVLPRELFIDETRANVLKEIFVWNTNTQGGTVFHNTKRAIQIYRDKSQTSLNFPVKMTDSAYNEFKAAQIPFRTYEIKSSVYYTYELRNSMDITVNPPENV